MQLEHEHTTSAIAKRLSNPPRASLLRDWVYGGIDGAVTTFAIVAGVVGASLSTNIILILGAANVLADGFSMAASNYAGTKAELEEMEHFREIERKHIEVEPEGEQEEIRHILKTKGVSDDHVDGGTAAITSTADYWIETMLLAEYGISPVERRPVMAAISTFVSFLICGCLPLVPFLFASEGAFAMSAVMVGIVFFAIGSVKSRWSIKPWWYSGLETLAIGTAAASVAFGVGYLLRGWA